METIQCTIRIRLRPTPEQAALLLQTLHAYTTCFNDVCAIADRDHSTNGVELHKLTYATHRATTTLPAQLVCAARVKATEAIKSVLAIRKKETCRRADAEKSGKKRKPREHRTPHSPLCAIRYDRRSYTFWRDRRAVSLVPVQQPGARTNRAIIPVTIPSYYARYLAKEWQTDSADLIYRKSAFWLHIVVSRVVAAVPATGTAIGVDVGIHRIAVTSLNTFYGGKAKKEINNRYFRLRRKLQSKGTTSAKRHLKRLSGRLARFQTDTNHCVSKAIALAAQPGDTIAMENVTDIRDRVKGRREQRRALSQWNFAQLHAFTAYKAVALGVHSECVDARYSSQGCRSCGHIARSNRVCQSEFHCRKCGYQLNADLNASRNLAQRATCVLGGQPVNLPIVAEEETLSGTSPAL